MPPMETPQARWFDEEVLPHVPAVRAYLTGRFQSLADVDDLLQEAFVRLLNTYDKGRVNSPRALLFTTARNLALDAIRRKKIIAFEPLTETGRSSVYIDKTDVVGSIDKKQELELLAEAVRALPERCRRVVTLRMAHGLSQKEIAARLGISENTVGKQMARGIRGCTKFFALRGFPPAAS
jgi:RNA polymerase sigma-70 factor (ECF subfamily)